MLQDPSSLCAPNPSPQSVHERFLRCSARHAFEVYTGRIGEWWDPNYSANAETLRAVTIEPRWVDACRAGALAHTFTLAQDPEAPSEVSVEFTDDDGACNLRFAHGGWTEANSADRAKFNDWPVLLERFARMADGPA